VPRTQNVTIAAGGTGLRHKCLAAGHPNQTQGHVDDSLQQGRPSTFPWVGCLDQNGPHAWQAILRGEQALVAVVYCSSLL
jgi:hypothetical protein